jgi:type I restriction enzyme S subunit
MATKNNDKTLNVPHLRFPEFSGEWETTSIGEQFELYSGNTPTRINKNQFNGSINWITSGELKGHYISDTKEKISEEAVRNNNLKILPLGTFVIAIYGLEADGVRSTCSITAKESTISQACMAFTSKKDIQNEFLYSWYKKHGNIIGIKYAQGTKQQNLSYDIIEKFNISYPSLEEQEKLIRFISLIEERIATQNKIIEKLESLIRGLCLKLVSQGIPNTALNTCLECHSSILQEKSVTTDGKYPVYGAAGICGYSNTPEASGDSILIIKDGASVGATFYVSGEYSAIGTLNRLTARSGCSLRYLYYCLKIFDFSQYKTGQAIPHIYFRDYGIAKIWCPSLAQQEYIAGILTSIDTKIQMERSLLERLTIQKRFLLQQMFI